MLNFLTKFRAFSYNKGEIQEKDRLILKILTNPPAKRIGKQERERKVLLGLVDYYIKTGKPVGSNTLKETGFEDLSSATIRNYFSHLEEEGYLIQSHASGGRIPTAAAYRIYAQAGMFDKEADDVKEELLDSLRQFDSREIALFLLEAAERLSQATQCAVFLSAPRFDHDFIVDIKLVGLDPSRCLAILITDFGVIYTEIFHLPTKLSSFAIKRVEGYFHWRLTGRDHPENLEPEEEAIGQSLYHELMLRYIVGYSNFIDEEIYRTGFSRLLIYPDFQEANALASGLSLFEDVQKMRLLLRETKSSNHLKVWIGEDLSSYVTNPNCSILTIPYCIHYNAVGAVGLLGPMRLPYRKLFGCLRLFADAVGETLTRLVYKFKIQYRQPEAGTLYLQKEESRLIGQPHFVLLEDKRN